MCVTWMCILLMQSVYVVSWVQEDKKLDYWLGTFKFSSVQTLLSNKMIVTHFKESFIITIVIIKISINYKKKGFSSVKLLQPGHSLSSCLSVSSPKHQWHHHHHQCMATVHCALQWCPHTYIINFKKEFTLWNFVKPSLPVCHSATSPIHQLMPEYNVILFTLTNCTSTL